ncbi:HAD-superfamily class IIA hydrolase, TIGR01459 [Paracoccus isoporae]|uniref:HAD-superfamily class IIA hydrolase, TIGR01459 n=1 Tax=Paracoccus isoporae TaxID=591205 RepID=A0A1G7H4T9_9RHOB|nr:HAD-IIA family hydrolase [Paracoccus isoporae]SDE95467.1 HAD-superfamily class IIA hydrolase, TIGR01459 [Paracoccus isoporae]
MTLPDARMAASAIGADTLTVDAAFDRYEAIRPRLPEAGAGGQAGPAPDLLSVADDYDGFLFDSFGVLNVGETAIAGAAECLEALRREGKLIRILTNAASYTSKAALEKYRRLGLEVAPDEVVSSRDVTFAHLDSAATGLRWGAIAAEGDVFEDASDADIFDLLDPGADWEDADGIIFMSSARWTPELQERLVAEISRRPRPVVVGNPDLVAPRESGLTIEPGYWAHDLQDRTGVEPRLFGKPYPEAFTIACKGIAPGRYAMIGDTLHTDILGGQAAGLDTILVTDHGLFAGRDAGRYVRASGIVPDIVMRSI